MRTLVIILAQTRAHKLTYESFERHLLNPLKADLCVCTSVDKNYDYTNKFHTNAKYKFLLHEPEDGDFGPLFEHAYEILIKDIENPIYWRDYLRIKDQFMGGVKDPSNEHPGSAGILIFFRWFLQKSLIESNLLEYYDRFVITRSDYIYTMDHAPLELLDEKCIWIPNCADWGGYTDRHVVLSKHNIFSYLNIFESLIDSRNNYYEKMKKYKKWNLERLIKFHLDNGPIVVKRFPYVMYAVREIGGSTRWSKGNFNEKLGYYIKYPDEFKISHKYKDRFKKSGQEIETFYKKII